MSNCIAKPLPVDPYPLDTMRRVEIVYSIFRGSAPIGNYQVHLHTKYTASPGQRLINTYEDQARAILLGRSRRGTYVRSTLTYPLANLYG
jgi:hypothetical protein